MKRKKFFILAAGLMALAFLSASCGNGGISDAAAGTDAGGSGGVGYWNEEKDPSSNTSYLSQLAVDYSDFDRNDTWDANACQILLEGDGASVSDSGAAVSNGSPCVITITKGGTYLVSGTLQNGRLFVEAGEEQVHLILNGADISCDAGAPIYLNNGRKTVITLAPGSENRLTDGTDAVVDALTGEPNAALFSKKALTLNGSGTLSVTGNFNNGITCKDDLKIMDGTIFVTAKNHGIRGNDSVVINGGTISVTAAEGDGIKATKQDNSEKGYVYIAGGTVTLEAKEDGVQAVTLIEMTDGSLFVTCGKDGFHTDGNLQIGGGQITVSAGDDGMHADGTLTVCGGSIDIKESYEGLEGLAIRISGGSVHLNAADDGLNAANGSNGTTSSKGGGFGFGGPGGGGMAYDASCVIEISGGYLYVDADGDGLDSNGDLTISGGAVIINGPENGGNGALDANGTILVSGGFLVAAGSREMAEIPDAMSTQNVVAVTFTGVQQAGTLLRIADADGKELLNFTPAKSYASVVFSSPDLKSGTEYCVYAGGIYSGGSMRDGLYADGSYEEGSLFESVTISSIISYVGSAGGMGRPGGMGGGPRPGGMGGRG